ncbi:hypothetical protein [Streptomyces sp. NPDC046685]|uniref:D-alanyl-D-alanine carboxypeptidase family protein n=1 Tax=Streptomyces sp. NPDC046685 TaxID=3157202 RepID=UPI0033D2425A
MAESEAEPAVGPERVAEPAVGPERVAEAEGEAGGGDAEPEGGPEAGPGPGKPDALREAVAAWVATADDAESGDAEGGADERRADAPKAGAAAGKDSASASAPVPTAEAKADEPADSERTAVFRAVKLPSGSGSDSGSGSGSASVPADEVKGDAPADSERTAVFRAVKPPTTPASKKPDSASGSGSAPSGAAPVAPAKPEAQQPADSERTAVFRVPKPDSASAQPAADGERTAVFRVPRPDNVKPDAVKPALAKPAPAKPAPATPKGSTFVPLRTEGEGGGKGAGAAPKPAAGQQQTAPRPPAPPATSTSTSAAAAAADRTERTTQQPLPPRPPLDMLADLTNNPPPPPSPLRTAVRRFKIYAPLVVLLAIILGIVQLVRPLPEPKLVMTEKSSYTFDGSKPELPWPSEGQAYMAAAGLGTIGQSGEQKPVPIASVTKSMTAYIILRDHPVKKGEQGQMIEIDKTAETEGKKNDSVNNESTLDTVKEGDKISEYDAIAALMIPSANNIARLLARWDSGSQEAFVKKMNDTAKELGMTNTTYTDPSGLDATTVSTAEDQVKLGLKLVEIETLLDITKKPSWIDPSGKSWRNWNGLVPYNDSLGIKTGTTTKAGGNLLFAAQKKIGNTNQLIVGAVLGQHKSPIIDTVLAASKQLMIATQKSLEGATVVKKGSVVGYVDDGLGGRTPVVATADVQAVGWASLTVKLKLADGGGAVPQSAKAGTEIGVLTVGEGASQVKVPVALKSDLAAPGIGSKLTRVG